jgi:hypothetical protein
MIKKNQLIRRNFNIRNNSYFNIKRVLILGVFFIIHSIINSVFAQLITPLSQEMNFRIETELYKSGKMPFTVFKPFYDSQLTGNTRFDSLHIFNDIPGTDKTWLKRKLFRESFLQIDSGAFYLYADPLLDFELGKENSGRKTMINTRGFRAGGRLGEHFAFGTELYENQAIFPTWLDSQFHKINVIPGQGRSRVTNNTWDYSYSTGYISFTPAKNLNIQAAMGKNFIGDGYRSLFLSDASMNYPFVKTTWLTKNFMYSWMVGSVQNTGLVINIKSNEEPYKRESIAVHLLSFNLIKHIQLSFVNCQIFNIPDTTGRVHQLYRLLNPLMLPVADDNKVHSIWGLNLKFKLSNTLWVYNQWVFDNLISGEDIKTSLQLGFKYFDILGIRGLYFQGEFNRIPAGTYTSGERSLQWMNFGESLAHPYGHNITEFVGILKYNYRRWQLHHQTSYCKANQSLTSFDNVISPYIPYFVSNQKLLTSSTELNFFVNPKTLMHFSLGYTYRNAEKTYQTTSSCIYFAFRTNLVNLYYDR